MYQVWKYNANLHSNMVRFIILATSKKLTTLSDLHSNMVRFIINFTEKIYCFISRFTFQYG